MTAATKRRRPARPKKPPRIVTTRPDPDDPAPAVAYRLGACVILRIPTGEASAVLTPSEAKELAAILLLQADLAARTPKVAGGTYQLPD